MSDSDSEIDMNTPPDIVNAATNATNNLLPQKSRVKYEKAYKDLLHYTDLEKGMLEEETRTPFEARNERRQDDGEHRNQNQADHIELTDFKKPSPDSSNIAISDVNSEVSDDLEESNVSEGTNESKESDDKLQKMWDMNTNLLAAIAKHNNDDVKSLLNNGANPNATCHSTLRSACHIAALYNEDALRILLDAGAEKWRHDCKGITPLHYAAWADKPKNIGMILDFPEDIINEITKAEPCLTPEQETKIQEIRAVYKYFVDVAIIIQDSFIKDEWKTNDDVKDFGFFPGLELGYSALHAASTTGHPECVRVLLAAGADPNLRVVCRCTPLDVTGAVTSSSYIYSGQNRDMELYKPRYVETLQLLIEHGGRLSSDESLVNVLKRALSMRCRQALTLLLNTSAPINHQNTSGCTPMDHKAPANHRSAKMDFRAVNVMDQRGSTVLHWATRELWLDGVTEALLAKADITHKNIYGITALHIAAQRGDYNIVKEILDKDTKRESNLSAVDYSNNSPFSYALISGNADIVRLMLDLDKNLGEYLNRKINKLTPLTFAAENKYQELFILILKEQKKIPLENELVEVMNTIAKHNLWKLLSIIKEQVNPLLVLQIIWKSNALHEAMKNSSIEMIIALLKNGADLSHRNRDGQTAISLLMYHVKKPTEFMTELLDNCIITNKSTRDTDCKIFIDYRNLKQREEYCDIYKPRRNANDMNVLKALIETGDVHDQRSLLTHPVVESFLYLKWKKCSMFITFLILIYALFLIFLNAYIAIIYYHMDNKIKEQHPFILIICNQIFWKWAVIITFCLVSVVDFLFFASYLTKWRRGNKTIVAIKRNVILLWRSFNFITMWRCTKTICIKLILTIGGVIMIFIPMDVADNDIVRGVAVITVLLSWTYFVKLLSWTPKSGYYIHMYGKVSMNVLKVMLAFSFPLMGYSLCFMILMHSKEPFDGFISAVLKTMVMMSSEFEYENLVKNTTTLTSSIMLRIFFILFFIRVAIVLMNLMLAFAVSDLQELSRDGKQRRLMKQVECISALEELFEMRPFSSWPLCKWTKMKLKVPPIVTIKSDSTYYGKNITKIIVNKAQTLKETAEKNADDVDMKAKINEIFDITKKQSDLEKELSEIRKSINTVLEPVALKDKLASEKTIDRAVDRILEAFENYRIADRLVLEQPK